VTRKPATWDEFRAAGMLWWINRILHAFGWTITCQVEEDGTTSGAYPERVTFRGFDRADEEAGYGRVAHFLTENAQTLEQEAGYDDPR